MEKPFMAQLSRPNVFFLEIYSFNSLRYNCLEHIAAPKPPYYFNLYSFKSYFFKRVSLCYSSTLFIQQNKSRSMKGV